MGPTQKVASRLGGAHLAQDRRNTRFASAQSTPRRPRLPTLAREQVTTMPLQYVLYSVAQYVHSRTEERLNVGVVVYDGQREVLIADFRSEQASYRIKGVYPEVDRVGLAHYLADVEQG